MEISSGSNNEFEERSLKRIKKLHNRPSDRIVRISRYSSNIALRTNAASYRSFSTYMYIYIYRSSINKLRYQSQQQLPHRRERLEIKARNGEIILILENIVNVWS